MKASELTWLEDADDGTARVLSEEAVAAPESLLPLTLPLCDDVEAL